MASNQDKLTRDWRRSVIYQIYPRSYADTNGDGIGDLSGIESKLDYIATLGVDYVWLSPIFPSPMKDFGYDVSDYCGIHPALGTMADFDRLLQCCHDRGLRLMLDLVLSHTSDVHPWFKASNKSRTGDKSDWYVWADPKDDGSPPNNWISIFGGSAWTWHSARRQFYLHNFLAEQPDLNFHNREVRSALLDVARFWLEKGVDGFRLDTVNFYTHDARFRSNPARVISDQVRAGIVNPYRFQEHLYDKSRPETLTFLQDLRSLCRQYNDALLLGEIGDDDSTARIIEYTAGDNLLHSAYGFTFLDEHSRPGPKVFCAVLDRFAAASVNKPTVAWSFSNHDVDRVLTRWGSELDAEGRSDLARMLNVLLLSFGGVPCFYQGEELGLSNCDLEYDEIRDPYGINFWPDFKGRDGSRTPMPWSSSDAHGGFTTGKPWLPVKGAHRDLAVTAQEKNNDSVLASFRHALHWRRGQKVLLNGSLDSRAINNAVLVLERVNDSSSCLAVFNLTTDIQKFTLPPEWSAAQVPPDSPSQGVDLAAGKVSIGRFGFGFLFRS